MQLRRAEAGGLGIGDWGLGNGDWGLGVGARIYWDPGRPIYHTSMIPKKIANRIGIGNPCPITPPPDLPLSQSPINYSITRLPNYQIRTSVHCPRFRDEQLLVEADRITIGHACDEVPCGRIEAFRLDGAAVEELVRPLADLLPQTAQDARRLLELGGGDGVLVDRVEQKAPEREHCLEHALAHTDLRQAARERLGDDVVHKRR